MADDNTNQDASASSPGLGMKLTIAGIKRKFPSVKNITTDSLSTLMKSVQESSSTAADVKQKLLILDSRPTEEYIIGHIPGAVRVDYEADTDVLLSSIQQLHSPGPEDKVTIVCYCSVGYRSSIVAQKVAEYIKIKGLKQSEGIKVFNLEGSIFKWANENRPMVDSKDKKTVYTHPYNAVFGKLLRKELRKTALDDHCRL